MNIEELYALAQWFHRHHAPISQLYHALLAPLQHNATQPNKQPIEDQRNNLRTALGAMSLTELSLQQLKLLDAVGVANFIGTNGQSYVDDTFLAATFDPATAVNRTARALEQLQKVENEFARFIEVIDDLGVREAVPETSEGRATIRVVFQGEAGIGNVSEWKAAAEDWYLIVRGVAALAGEAPEDTKIIGASTGSIIIVLSGTYVVTEILARIAKKITETTKDVLELLHSKEDLRHKKVLNIGIEQAINLQVESLKSTAAQHIESDIQSAFPSEQGDTHVSLAKAVEKLMNFSEKGGLMDFVLPDPIDEKSKESQDSESDESVRSALLAARAAITSYQIERDAVQLLTDGSGTVEG